ncbi:MAG: Dam family site-specific DNA-(adenine-N6)-methyltransferase [Methylomarinum sp.]|nr:Dam family site-specific DNA-(adenine-N6)-methyltransferase [Methylomarinum sp.]
MIKSPLSGWMGGKYQLSKQIVSMIPKHHCYCEPFAGAAWVFFRKEQSKVEVLNDINAEIITLYRVVQNHLEEFIRYFKWILISRDEFNRWMKANPETLTDIQRSSRFFYLQKNSFAGRIGDKATFGYAPSSRPRMNLLRIEEDLSAAHLRLSQVYIENLNYLDLIKRYDREKTFFYIDPPYWNCENYYGDGIFSKADFDALAEILANIKGKFLLSLNDTPEVRKIFSAFIVEPVTLTYTCGTKPTKAKEVLIRNYELDK